MVFDTKKCAPSLSGDHPTFDSHLWRQSPCKFGESAFEIAYRLILDGPSGVQHKQARALPVRGGDQRGHPRGRQDPGDRKSRQVKARLAFQDAQVSSRLDQNARF